MCHISIRFNNLFWKFQYFIFSLKEAALANFALYLLKSVFILQNMQKLLHLWLK